MMENPIDPQEYVNEFVLDHLDGHVKREANNNQIHQVNNNETPPSEPTIEPTTNNPGGGGGVGVITAVEEITTSTILSRLPSLHNHLLMEPTTTAHHQLLTPPSHNNDDQMYHEHMMHHPIVRVPPFHHPHSPELHYHHGETPGTPPDTPPVSNSPASPGSHYQVGLESHPQFQNLHPLNKQELVDENMWVANQFQPQPLDLRPHCNGDSQLDWHLANSNHSVITGHRRLIPYDYEEQESIVMKTRRMKINEYEDVDDMNPHTPHSMMAIGRPLSVCSNNMGPKYNNNSEEIISEKVLMSLPVRDLNKRLHHLPKDISMKLKQKRRTLKNRGYAQNCRMKRNKERDDLEKSNRQLQAELKKGKAEINQLKQERNHYRMKYEELLRRVDVENPGEGIQDGGYL